MNPIRLRGFYQRIAADTGEILALFGTSDRPSSLLLVACKDRRSSCCPACAALYERDAYHLLATGLRGGKSVPASIGAHPTVMLTLTAPTFGAVHSNRDAGRPCKCGHQHSAEDPQLGTALDPDSYRYIDQVIWNHLAPELWKQTVLAIRRGIARALSVPRTKLTEVACVRFAKVAEFQRRGVVHYHAIIRVDGPESLDEPAPAQLTTELLKDVVSGAANNASVATPAILAAIGIRAVRWGAQRQIVALDQHSCTSAAGYIAKYAIKATETATGGTLIKPIRSPSQLPSLEVPDHPRRLIAAAWTTADRTGIEALKRWAHQFGYGGHTLTKSHQYSVTFAALRAARADWRRQTIEDKRAVIVRSTLSYAGRGYPAADWKPSPERVTRHRATRGPLVAETQTRSGLCPDINDKQRSRDDVSSAAATLRTTRPRPTARAPLTALDTAGSAPLPPPPMENGFAGRRLLTARAVAGTLDVCTETVLRWIRNGQLPAIRLPSGAVRIAEHELNDWLQIRATPRRGVLATKPDAADRTRYPSHYDGRR